VCSRIFLRLKLALPRIYTGTKVKSKGTAKESHAARRAAPWLERCGIFRGQLEYFRARASPKLTQVNQGRRVEDSSIGLRLAVSLAQTATLCRAMLSYPPWFTVIECRLIDEALGRAKPPLIPLETSPGSRLVDIGATIQSTYESDAAAVDAVLHVAEIVVEVVSAPRTRRDRRTRLEAGERLIAEIIVALATFRSPSARMRFADFAIAARMAVKRCSWWIRFMALRPTPTAEAASAMENRAHH